MSAVKTPKPTRREQAAETRARIIRAAIEVFGERGYTGARMTDIGERAGVAVQTVYFTFHTKPELLQACFEYAVLGPDRLPPHEQPFWAKVAAATNGPAALRAFAVGNAEIVVRAGPVDEVARAASHEPDVVEIRRHSESLRRDGYRQVVTGLAERFGLRDGLDVERGTDLLLLLAGGQTWVTLRDYGWSQQEYVDWLATTAAEQLLGP